MCTVRDGYNLYSNKLILLWSIDAGKIGHNGNIRNAATIWNGLLRIDTSETAIVTENF